MDLLEFNSKLSSPSQERVQQFSINSLLFNLINGMHLKENELVQIGNEGNTMLLRFSSEQCAKNIKENITAKIIPGVYGHPLYGIMADQTNDLLLIDFIEL